MVILMVCGVYRFSVRCFHPLGCAAQRCGHSHALEQQSQNQQECCQKSGLHGDRELAFQNTWLA